ncbi:AbrB/MazE/SpoVT family DNA-binding domain-containing protein [Halorientalis pallida]|uniref:AbrB/MazE/SpoVT family DNA-binding domain-containing protein n=1 Tax=Halorientalis pallida TaxID=2479928 RepID=UPI003C6FE731
MGVDETSDETTLNDRYAVTVPAAIRERLDVEPGDKIRWSVSDDGDLSVEVVRQRTGVFQDFEPVDMGETDAANDHSLMGIEREMDADERES